MVLDAQAVHGDIEGVKEPKERVTCQWSEGVREGYHEQWEWQRRTATRQAPFFSVILKVDVGSQFTLTGQGSPHIAQSLSSCTRAGLTSHFAHAWSKLRSSGINHEDRFFALTTRVAGHEVVSSFRARRRCIQRFQSTRLHDRPRRQRLRDAALGGGSSSSWGRST
jgi:hypothetical protein